MTSGQIRSASEEPEETGAEPTQTRPTPEELAALERPPDREGLTCYPVTESVRLLSEVRGQSGMVLLLTTLRNLEDQVNQLRRERDALANQRDDLRERLHGSDSDNRVLKERIRTGNKLSVGQNIANTLGSVLLGYAVPELVKAISGGTIALVSLGLVLLVVGWYPANPSTEA